jgi:hypothetical protein
MAIPGPTPGWSAQPRAGYQINSTAISADGSVMITGTSAEFGSADDFGIYCYQTTDGSSGSLLWSDPLGRPAFDGVFWVAMSADGRFAAAGGSYETGGGGFLRLYSVTAGASSRQEFATTSRVNEVEMSADGSVVVAVYGDRADVYTLVDGRYQPLGSQTFADCYVRSCGLTPDGVWIVVGGESRSGEPVSSRGGMVAVLLNDQGTLQVAASMSPAYRVLRVVIAGAFVAASTAGGTVALYYRVMGPAYQEAWTTSAGRPLGDVYALAIAQTDAGTFVGAGGNAPGTSPEAGWVFVIQNVPSGAGFAPVMCWIQPTTYAPNPATNFDAAGSYLTAADGEPTGSAETAGHFYLYDAMSGAPAWSAPYGTSLMNWAMAINAAGSACFGGSDDGCVYYWGRPS